MSCLFCDIAAGRRASKRVHEDEHVVAFHDIHPQAPTHVLVIPKKHVASLLEVTPDDDVLLGRVVRTARELAERLGHGEKGFRLVMNCGPDSGYSVPHVHLHLLGGRQMAWPPG